MGMDCIFVNHVNTETVPPATYSIRHLKELEEIL